MQQDRIFFLPISSFYSCPIFDVFPELHTDPYKKYFLIQLCSISALVVLYYMFSSGVTVKIEPGVTFRIRPNIGFLVLGRLMANGLSRKPIKFLPYSNTQSMAG